MGEAANSQTDILQPRYAFLNIGNGPPQALGGPIRLSSSTQRTAGATCLVAVALPDRGQRPPPDHSPPSVSTAAGIGCDRILLK